MSPTKAALATFKDGNHANTSSQRSCIEINPNDDHSISNGNFPASHVGVVPSVNHSKKAEVISGQKGVITVPGDNVHQTHMVGASGVNSRQNNLHEKNLIVTIVKIC